MVTMAEPLDVDRPFTVADLETTPDDGRRYEVIDGRLIVSPAPSWPHQEAGLALYRLLYDAAPPDMRVLAAPFGVRIDFFNEVQPDVLVARYTDLRFENLPTAPLLAVEVLSRSSRLSDYTLKRGFYARIGVRSYWLVEPDLDQPKVTALVLDGDDYCEIAKVTGDERFDATEPFPVTVVPSALVRGLFP